MSSLVIVESPAKAKTIERFLGKDYRVEASFGHVRDLPEKADEVPQEIKDKDWANIAVNIEGDFTPYYVVPKSKQKYVKMLKSALKGADELLLATDEDREGESISWHLLQLLNPNVPVKRIVFHEITREAIEHALENPRGVNEDLVHAQESRRILDRLYGYTLSPLLWKKVSSGLSAGRVQSVALRLLVEREEERRAFVSAEYWDLEAILRNGRGDFKATLSRLAGKRIASGRDFDSTTGKRKNTDALLLGENDAKALAREIGSRLPWTVSKVEEKPGTQRPAPPFTTSTLQQEANRKLGYTAKRTMQVAQRLYEGVDLGASERIGLITYMRTDSVTLSDKALGDAQRVIKSIYGDQYAQGPRRYKTKQRSAQEAHEAIRPTGLERRPQDVEKHLNRDEFRLYELIWKRTLASQMPDAKVLRTSVEISAKDEQGREVVFSAGGKRITFPGFLRAYVEGSDDPEADLGDKETILPPLKVGDPIPGWDHRDEGKAALVSVDPKGHETQPPSRYTEAALVKKLEEEGVGRPSTYASIISTIQDRGYAFKQKAGSLVPTFTGMVVIDLLRQHFNEYVDIHFTARMEEELDQIATGDMGWQDHVREFYKGNGNGDGLQARVKREADRMKYPVLEIGKDPETGDSIGVKVGRYGPYLVRGEGGQGNIGNIPKDMAPADLDVEKARELIEKKAEGPREIGTDPETGMKVYAATGRYGPYVQLGETPEDKKQKPKRASIPKEMSEDDVELEFALKLLSLPRELGRHPDDNEPVLANIGRYGPYVQHNRDFRSIPADKSVYTITFDEAMELLKQPKARGGKQELKTLGQGPEGKDIKLMQGRYGPYVTDGKTNATLPKGTDLSEVTLEQANELIAKKAAAGPSKKKGKGGKKSAKGKK